MRGIVGNDSGMIFGPTGSGKSMLIRSVVQSAVQQGVKVAMCVTEGNYFQEDVEWLQEKTTYHYTNTLDGICKWARSLNKSFDFVVVDSVGGPGYGALVRANMKEAGNIFQKMAEVTHELQTFCNENGAMGLSVNQPTSELVALQGKEQEPLGGKSNFYSGEVMKTMKLEQKRGYSIMRLDAHKSRHMRDKFIIANIAISDDRVGVRFMKYEGRKSKGWPETECVLHNPLLEGTEQTDADSDAPAGDVPEMEVDEGAEGDFGDDGEELKAVLGEIAEIRDEKGIKDVQFKAIMQSKKVDVEFAEQIHDLDTAGKVKDILKNFGTQETKLKEEGALL
jgi:hypothetical protein